MIRYAFELFIGLLLIVFALYKTDFIGFVRRTMQKMKNAEVQHEQREVTFFTVLTLLVLLFLFAFVLFYKVAEVPIPYEIDEAGMAYDAINIVNYGVDRFMYKNPVYFINFGGGQNALYTYLAALSVRLFGYSALSLRLPAVLLSCLAALSFALLMRSVYGNAASIFGMGLFIVLPFSVMHSRWGLESYLLFPMLMISCALFALAVRKEKTWIYAVSGISFGITLYSYALSYIIIPVLLAVCIAVLVFTKKMKWKYLFAMGIPLFLLAFPLILLLAVNNGLIEEIRTSFISIPKLDTYRSNDINIQNIPGNIKFDKANIFYRILFFDMLPYNAIVQYGTMYYFSIPLILWGGYITVRNAINSLKERKFSVDFLMAVLFLTSFLFSLMLVDININRTCEIFIPLFYFLCTALTALWQKKRMAAAAAALIFLIHFGSFYHYYLTDYSEELIKPVFIHSIDDVKEAMDFIETIDDGEKTTYFIRQPYIWAILALEVDPETFMKEKIYENTCYDKYRFLSRYEPEMYTPDSIFISKTFYKIPDDLLETGFVCKYFNSMVVCYMPEN